MTPITIETRKREPITFRVVENTSPNFATLHLSLAITAQFEATYQSVVPSLPRCEVSRFLSSLSVMTVTAESNAVPASPAYAGRVR
jgi:hypothetical protein